MKYRKILFMATMSISITSYAANKVIIFDAGSSGTRMYIYAKSGHNYTTEFSNKNKIPLASFANDPSTAYTAIDDLLDKAKASGENIDNIPMYIYATAGMRYIPADQQGAIYDNIRSHISEQGYQLKTTETISGDDEGLYGWVSLNYLTHNLGGEVTNGALDLGGASTQITFETTAKYANKTFTYNGKSYYVFAKSFLGMGQDKAYDGITSTLVARQSCFPKSYWTTELTGGHTYEYDFKACSKLTKRYAKANGYNLSRVEKIKKHSNASEFYAFSGYFYAADYFGYTGSSTLNEIEKQTNKACSTDWSNFSKIHGLDQYTPLKCFDSAYLYGLLNHYGFDDDDNIIFKDEISGTGIDWTLGVAIKILSEQ